MLKFKSIVKEETPVSAIGNTIYYGSPRVEYNDVWIKESSILNYRPIVFNEDKECLQINFKSDTFNGMSLSNSFVLCKKQDEEIYNKLISK